MGTRFRSWWQQIKQHRVAIGVVGIVSVVVILIIIIGYQFDWTGFNGYNKVTITHTISGTNAGTVNRTEEYQPGKALWDWLGLLAAFAIPIVVGFGAAWFTTKQTQASEAANKRQHDTELEISTDNQREAALQAYIDKISELLLKEHLGERTEDGELKPEYEQVRNIARVRTLTVLPSLDKVRKGSVLLFLKEARLINKDKVFVDLSGADFREVNLSGADLSGAWLNKVNLSGADLREAFLLDAYLGRAKLSGAWLYHATLINATLGGANLSGSWLDKVSFRDADLSKADLSKADLKDAFLEKTNFRDADLSKADLRDAYLHAANLVGAKLSGAKLSGANLTNANLKDAIGITTEELEKQARSLKGATMPDGSIHP